MAAVDASPRSELDPNPNPDSNNPPSTPPQNSAETPNPANPSPSVNPHPSTPIQASTPQLAASSFNSPFGHMGMQQYGGGAMSPNPSFQMGAGLQPPGVGTSQASPTMRPVGMFQQMQYGQVQNGYMAAGAIPPPACYD